MAMMKPQRSHIIFQLLVACICFARVVVFFLDGLFSKDCLYILSPSFHRATYPRFENIFFEGEADSLVNGEFNVSSSSLTHCLQVSLNN